MNIHIFVAMNILYTILFNIIYMVYLTFITDNGNRRIIPITQLQFIDFDNNGTLTYHLDEHDYVLKNNEYDFIDDHSIVLHLVDLKKSTQDNFSYIKEKYDRTIQKNSDDRMIVYVGDKSCICGKCVDCIRTQKAKIKIVDNVEYNTEINTYLPKPQSTYIPPTNITPSNSNASTVNQYVYSPVQFIIPHIYIDKSIYA